MNSLNPWLAGGALLGVVAACWSRLKLLLSRFLSLFIVRARLDGELGNALATYCWHHFRRSPFGERRYDSSKHYVRPVERYQTVGYEIVGTDPVVFWIGWRPLFLVFSKVGDSDKLGYGIALSHYWGHSHEHNGERKEVDSVK